MRTIKEVKEKTKYYVNVIFDIDGTEVKATLTLWEYEAQVLIERLVQEYSHTNTHPDVLYKKLVKLQEYGREQGYEDGYDAGSDTYND